MNRFVSYLLFILILISSCAIKSDEKIRFAVIGDVHYRAPNFERTSYYVPLISEILDSTNVDPEFIIQTGDFFHSGGGVDVDVESSFAFQHFSKNIKRPFIISKGNHDQRNQFEKEVLPLHSDFLKKKNNKKLFFI